MLCAALDGLLLPPPCDGDGPVEVRCAYATEHRAGLLLRSPGRGLSARVTGTDPLRDGRPLLASAPADGPASAEGARSARAVNAACAALRAALAVHPLTAARARAGRPTANVLLLRGPGGCATERPFAEVHPRWGAPAVVAPTRMIAGLALALRCALLPVAGATGDYRTDLAAKAAAGAAVLRPGSPHRLLLLHVKAVDDAGHDRNVAHRVAYLQAVDAMVGQLCARLWADRLGSEGGAEACLVAVTGDHSTPVLYGDHGAEPVPLAVAHLADWVAAAGGAAALAAWPMGPIPTPEFEAPPLAPGPRPRPPAGRDPGVAAVAGDGVTAFDECAAALGGLGRFPGSQLMSLLTRLAETRAETRGE